jgi:hypothetical protein
VQAFFLQRPHRLVQYISRIVYAGLAVGLDRSHQDLPCRRIQPGHRRNGARDREDDHVRIAVDGAESQLVDSFSLAAHKRRAAAVLYAGTVQLVRFVNRNALPPQNAVEIRHQHLECFNPGIFTQKGVELGLFSLIGDLHGLSLLECRC